MVTKWSLVPNITPIHPCSKPGSSSSVELRAFPSPVFGKTRNTSQRFHCANKTNRILITKHNKCHSSNTIDFSLVPYYLVTIITIIVSTYWGLTICQILDYLHIHVWVTILVREGPLYTGKLRQRWDINLGCLTCNSASLPSSGGEKCVVLYQKVYKVPFCIYSCNKHVLRVYCLPSHAWPLGKWWTMGHSQSLS